jgi:predicted AlkP superfamily phosphohydrolase/phosphomutase
MEEGKLPNLRRIAREGVSGRLRSFQPLVSPRIWNSIATGKVPLKHGIAAFVRHAEDAEDTLLVSTDRKVPALWNILSDLGHTVAVVGWWTTYPAERVLGVMVTDHAPKAALGSADGAPGKTTAPSAALVYPADMQPRLLGLLASAPAVTDAADPFAGDGALPHWVQRAEMRQMVRKDNAVAHVALTIAEERRPDLLMVYLSAIDPVCHRLWGTLEPEELYPAWLRGSAAERAAGAAAIRHTYEFVDALIGALADRYARDDLVMVVSDHGFEAGKHRFVEVTGVHSGLDARYGVLFAKGRGIPAGERAGKVTVNDITPTILAWFGLPVARDMDGRPAEFLRVPRKEPVPTYDHIPVQRPTADPSGVERDMIRQLRALGYLE